MFSLLWTLIVGLDRRCSREVPHAGKDPGGILITMLSESPGAFIGTYAGRFLGLGETYQAGFLMSIVGALVVLGIYRLIAGRRGHTLSASTTYPRLSWICSLAPVAQLDRASASGAEGPAFESRRVYYHFGVRRLVAAFLLLRGPYRKVRVDGSTRCGTPLRVKSEVCLPCSLIVVIPVL